MYYMFFFLTQVNGVSIGVSIYKIKIGFVISHLKAILVYFYFVYFSVELQNIKFYKTNKMWDCSSTEFLLIIFFCLLQN